MAHMLPTFKLVLWRCTACSSCWREVLGYTEYLNAKYMSEHDVIC